MGREVKLNTSSIGGVKLAVSSPACDKRGMFYRAYCEEELETIIGTRQIVQMNISRTNSVGAIRGLHYQNVPNAEMKMIRCIKGKVWDVAVDLRSDSPTFLQWYGVELSSENYAMVIIPEGCAHGFQVLEEGSELIYLHTAKYSPQAEGAIHYDDPMLGIKWPLSVTDVSQRDLTHKFLSSDFKGLTL